MHYNIIEHININDSVNLHQDHNKPLTAEDSLLIVGYQLSWIWWVKKNHEIKC